MYLIGEWLEQIAPVLVLLPILLSKLLTFWWLVVGIGSVPSSSADVLFLQIRKVSRYTIFVRFGCVFSFWPRAGTACWRRFLINFDNLKSSNPEKCWCWSLGHGNMAGLDFLGSCTSRSPLAPLFVYDYMYKLVDLVDYDAMRCIAQTAAMSLV